ncbi:MAG: hypothetical protein HY089_02520 [Ignavibacteriales bacterium]|nr:hypothetical protein [Ignavibacteriales bacterium]
MTTLEVISRLVSFLAFTAIGLALSKKIPLPKTGNSWIVWIFSLLVLGYIDIGSTVWLISIDGFTIYFNTALQGCGFGILVGFLLRSFIINKKKIHLSIF